MKWAPFCLAGSDVFIIADVHGFNVYAFKGGDIFLYDRQAASQLANRVGESHPFGQGLRWTYEGTPDEVTLYLRDEGADPIGMIRTEKRSGGNVEVFHHDEADHVPDGMSLTKSGLYDGMNLIGRLRELANGLTGARTH